MKRPAGVVLAAGLARRFGGQKLLAEIDGRPLILHSIDAALEARLDPIVVVVGPDPDLRAVLSARPVRVIENPRPEDGLASSVRAGFAALADTPAAIGAAVVLLGDQPRVGAAVIDRLVNAIAPEPFVVPEYADRSNPNPVLVRRQRWSVAAELTGDRGFGAWMADHPHDVAQVTVDAANPDIDTREDVAALVLADWAARVRANQAQAERVREAPERPDFYAPTSTLFRADPDRGGDPVLDVLLEIARPGDRWLDIGGGAGRYALPLARRVAEVIVVDPSAAMLEGLREGMRAASIQNIRPVHARWPIPSEEPPGFAIEPSDVALIAHVGYDIAEIGPFLDAMEASAERTCVAVLADRSPAWVAERFWPPIHGEERVGLPAEREFVALLKARGHSPEVRHVQTPPRPYPSRDGLHALARQQVFVEAGGAKDEALRRLTEAAMVETDGGVRFDHAEPARIGIATWSG